MLALIKWILIPLIVLSLLILLFLFGMRFHDGPLEIFSGGPFTTGTPADNPPDWNFIAERDTIDFQTMRPETSRKVWFLVYEGRLFVVSGYMTTDYGKLWKQWPHYIMQDNRILLRIDGKLYRQRMERIHEGDIIAPVMDAIGRKYGYVGTAESVTSGYSWLYEVLPRRTGGNS